jgi:transglutaminase-like putative cysteine protease
MARARVVLTVSLGLTALAALAWAAGPLLHEYIPADPREDLMLGTTTATGDLPAAMETKSGIVTAPDPFRQPSPSERAYSRNTAPESSMFYPDRDTRTVPEVEYDDPFSPSLTPYKRLSAYDAVNADYTLKVADPAPRRVAPGGNAQPGEDPFYGDLTVDLVPGELVRVPSTGPGMRVLRVQTVPAVPVELVRDGAENLFVRGTTRGRVRLLVHVASPRAGFVGQLRDVLWTDLPQAPALPRAMQTVADDVNRTIGVSRAMSFRDAVDRLVSYYRAFSTSDEPLPSKGDIFVDIALSKKGVCRHRAFAFVVSALALRIPARLVANEAHAWVEVSDGRMLQRIDLGGAAPTFNEVSPEDRVAHVPPADPFAWPAGSRSGRDAASRSADPGGSGGSSGSASSGSSGSGGARSRSSDPGAPDVPPPSDAEDARPRSTIRLTFVQKEIFRNQAVELEGKVDSPAGACAFVRVDAILSAEHQEIPLGSLATDDGGRFQGAVVVPPSVPVGDYELVLVTPGDARCGRGRVEGP